MLVYMCMFLFSMEYFSSSLFTSFSIRCTVIRISFIQLINPFCILEQNFKWKEQIKILLKNGLKTELSYAHWVSVKFSMYQRIEVDNVSYACVRAWECAFLCVCKYVRISIIQLDFASSLSFTCRMFEFSVSNDISKKRKTKQR